MPQSFLGALDEAPVAEDRQNGLEFKPVCFESEEQYDQELLDMSRAIQSEADHSFEYLPKPDELQFDAFGDFGSEAPH